MLLLLRFVMPVLLQGTSSEHLELFLNLLPADRLQLRSPKCHELRVGNLLVGIMRPLHLMKKPSLLVGNPILSPVYALELSKCDVSVLVLVQRPECVLERFLHFRCQRGMWRVWAEEIDGNGSHRGICSDHAAN